MIGIVEIRDAQPPEESALSALHRRASYVWEEDRVHLDAHPDALGVPPQAIAEGRVRVAVRHGGALVGFLVIADATEGSCILDDLFVDPDFMRQGIGRALVEDAAARALCAEYREMTVVAHPRIFPFYESVGFVAGEPVGTRFGPAVRMRRPLVPAGPLPA